MHGGHDTASIHTHFNIFDDMVFLRMRKWMMEFEWNVDFGMFLWDSNCCICLGNANVGTITKWTIRVEFQLIIWDEFLIECLKLMLECVWGYEMCFGGWLFD